MSERMRQQLDENQLRDVAEGRDGLTLEQRQWCADEIDRTEPSDVATLLTNPDRDLARAVLRAWTDYANGQ